MYMIKETAGLSWPLRKVPARPDRFQIRVIVTKDDPEEEQKGCLTLHLDSLEMTI